MHAIWCANQSPQIPWPGPVHVHKRATVIRDCHWGSMVGPHRSYMGFQYQRLLLHQQAAEHVQS